MDQLSDMQLENKDSDAVYKMKYVSMDNLYQNSRNNFFVEILDNEKIIINPNENIARNVERIISNSTNMFNLQDISLDNETKSLSINKSTKDKQIKSPLEFIICKNKEIDMLTAPDEIIVTVESNCEPVIDEKIISEALSCGLFHQTQESIELFNTSNNGNQDTEKNFDEDVKNLISETSDVNISISTDESIALEENCSQSRQESEIIEYNNHNEIEESINLISNEEDVLDDSSVSASNGDKFSEVIFIGKLNAFKTKKL